MGTVSLRNVVFFLNQLQIFLQLYLIELLGLLTGLGPARAVALDIPKAEFGMLIFFLNLRFMEFQIRYLVFFILFPVIGGFGYFWMAIAHKKIQLMLGFLKALFLVLNFSYYTLMTFLMMLSVILLSMLMIPFSISSVIRYLVCSNNLNWLLNLNLIHETLWIGERSGLLISRLGKVNWFRLTSLITLVLLM